MPVFISYSHSDSEFVDKFAAHLVKQNTHVWVDKWNLNVGDSIVSKVQEAIEESSALLVVLSKASVESEWCKKEINSGLMRELDEKKVIVLPILIDDCKIPLFLREKMYADFRTSFDKGLSLVADSLAKISNRDQSRVVTGEYHADWGMDWSVSDKGLLNIDFTIVEQAKDAPYTVLTQVSIYCNKDATARYEQYKNLGLDWFGRFLITTFITDAFKDKDIRFILENPKKHTQNVTIRDEKSNMEYTVTIVSRRLGEDTGKDILINISRYMADIAGYVKAITRPLTKAESALVGFILISR
ncbi:toll/interleukin-1 receptor domain-containing protein [Agitococcus lubricus]|uniref:ADP-ribosyl cyclase/cyclic ADP-ribose hydrolase n=1 Tax=Agitococcus lubricus TaxID=1077255 RepID=A0A2T5ITA0_9GAMM|nr:toll/interleukin-1 receptor domain-containing protein [Agitococcus lubricus]PTQ87073.1 TIR domain-containing protein [Agitococcus lubricus]